MIEREQKEQKKEKNKRKEKKRTKKKAMIRTRVEPVTSLVLKEGPVKIRLAGG